MPECSAIGFQNPCILKRCILPLGIRTREVQAERNRDTADRCFSSVNRPNSDIHKTSSYLPLSNVLSFGKCFRLLERSKKTPGSLDVKIISAIDPTNNESIKFRVSSCSSQQWFVNDSERTSAVPSIQHILQFVGRSGTGVLSVAK